MEDETVVQADDTAADSTQEATDQAQDDVKELATGEPVDESGVPIKNRQAEADRKARKARSNADAEATLLKGASDQNAEPDQGEAIRIVEGIVDQRAKKLIEPILARQFLVDHPDAADMVDDINRVRSSHPELASIDKLELAYKVARADKQDEIIRKQVEQRHAEEASTIQQGNQAAIEGTGKSRSTPKNLSEQIGAANSLEELAKLEALLS